MHGRREKFSGSRRKRWNRQNNRRNRSRPNCDKYPHRRRCQTTPTNTILSTTLTMITTTMPPISDMTSAPYRGTKPPTKHQSMLTTQTTPYWYDSETDGSTTNTSAYTTGIAVGVLIVVFICTIVICRRCHQSKNDGNEVSEETTYSTLNQIESPDAEGNVYMELIERGPSTPSTMNTPNTAVEVEVNPYFVLERTNDDNQSPSGEESNPYFVLEKSSEKGSVSGDTTQDISHTYCELDKVIGNEPGISREAGSTRRQSAQAEHKQDTDAMDVPGAAAAHVTSENDRNESENEKDSERSNMKLEFARSITILDGEKGNKYDEIVFEN